MAVHKDGYCVFIYLYIIYRKLTRIQYLIINETSCTRITCYKLCKGIIYSTTSCT